MTETKDREEIDLHTLASKFAEGDKFKARVWLKTLSEAVSAGKLDANKVSRSRKTLSIQGMRTDGTQYASGGATINRTVTVTTRAAVVAWVSKPPAFPLPALVIAWLGDERQATQAPENAAEPGKVEARKETIRAILAAIKELDPEFSHFAMPGQKADFFALCREHDPPAFKYVVQSTFNDYLSGLCKFRQGARPTNYYREISPRIGVKRIKAA